MIIHRKEKIKTQGVGRLLSLPGMNEALPKIPNRVVKKCLCKQSESSHYFTIATIQNLLDTID
jgi:hypothetical protein